MTKIIIAVCDDFLKQTIIHYVKAVNRGLEIIDGSNDDDLIYHLKSAEDDIVFFDKFFLGYILRFKIRALKVINKNLRIIFVEQGFCSRFFGLRVYDLKADGFVSDIQNEKEFIEKLRIIFSGRKIFPEEVLDSLHSAEHKTYRKYCSELSEQELEIAIYLGEGKSIKEISDLVHISEESVGTQKTRLKRKIGYKSMNDFCVLNRQMEKTVLRSWHCW